MTNPVLQLEINEISWRFLREYLGKKEYPHLDEFFRRARSCTSLVVDGGEMSPWVVWPTIHRGMSSEHHHIRNLGQDPASFVGTPIWEEVRAAGHSVGVFGPFQSWPPKDPGPGGFYIPDTFAHDERCFPRELEPLQRMNLALVGKNTRERSGGFLSSIHADTVVALLRSPVRWRTLARVGLQLLRERIDPRYCARRAIFQSVVFWDVFRGLYDHRNPPLYSSYFSNQLASSMHRYWNSLFPEDFPENLRPKDSFHRGTLDFAVKVLDEILADVLGWMNDNPALTVIFATGLGQDTYIRSRHEGVELTIKDPDALLRALGVPEGSYRRLLAMVPQVAYEVPDPVVRERIRAGLSALRFVGGGKAPFVVDEVGASLSITLRNPPAADSRAGCFLRAHEKVAFEKLGCRALEIEAGTAYHIPEAIFAVAGPGAEIFSRHWPEPRIPGDRIKEQVLGMMELSGC